MNKEWTDYFRFICSLYSADITELLKDTVCETEEEKTACYYEQAALVVFKHFLNLLRETGAL